MGTYVTIRGWLECDPIQIEQIRQIVSGDADDSHDGWAFPQRQLNWRCHVFYGASIREGALDWFLMRLRRIADICASDADNDRVVGLFLASHETDGMAEWQIRDGGVHLVPADPRHAYLDS